MTTFLLDQHFLPCAHRDAKSGGSGHTADGQTHSSQKVHRKRWDVGQRHVRLAATTRRCAGDAVRWQRRNRATHAPLPGTAQPEPLQESP